jgi:hypothetical protein
MLLLNTSAGHQGHGNRVDSNDSGRRCHRVRVGQVCRVHTTYSVVRMLHHVDRR